MQLQKNSALKLALGLAKTIADTQIKTSGAAPQAFIVGGYVRDMLMGIPGKDIDIEVYGLNVGTVDKIIRRSLKEYKITRDTDFGTWQATTPTQESGSNSLTAVRELEQVTFGISIPRTETASGKGHRGFTVKLNPHLSYEDALRRRDFTVNAMLFDPITKTLIDPFHGRTDIVKKALRIVDNKTFPHDPLRAWRAVQMVGRFDLRPTLQTMAAITGMAKNAAQKTLSNQRVRAELEKTFLNVSVAARALAFAHKAGLLNAWLPELVALLSTPAKRKQLEKELLLAAAQKPQDFWRIIIKALEPLEAQALAKRFQLPKKLTRNKRQGA